AYQPTHMRFGDFVCGLLAAHAARSGVGAFFARHLVAARLGLVAAATLVAAIIAVPPFQPSGPFTGAVGSFYLIVFPSASPMALASLIVVLTTEPAAAPRLVRVLSARPLYPLSQLSYSMYLLHPLVMFAGYFTVLNIPTVPRLSAYLGFVAVSIVLAAG